METRRKNAFAKAEKEKPVVAKSADGPNREFFSVNQYTVAGTNAATGNVVEGKFKTAR